MTLPYKTLIIDDESLARERLMLILAGFKKYFEIIGAATNGDEAFEKIEQLKPDLVFLDIQMPGKDVFEMLSEINHKPLIVFCTAFEDYALQAFENLSVDYLLKPIEKERVEFTISKLEHLHSGVSTNAVVNKLKNLKEKKYPTAIPYKIGERIVLVKLSEVTYFEADNKYVDFYDVKSEKYVTEQTLNKLEKILPPEFIRVSKSVIVNFNFVKELHKYFRGKFILIINDIKGSKIETGASYRNQINDKFSL
jgi:two-component system LytT family response regulator